MGNFADSHLTAPVMQRLVQKQAASDEALILAQLCSWMQILASVLLLVVSVPWNQVAWTPGPEGPETWNNLHLVCATGSAISAAWLFMNAVEHVMLLIMLHRGSVPTAFIVTGQSSVIGSRQPLQDMLSRLCVPAVIGYTALIFSTDLNQGLIFGAEVLPMWFAAVLVFLPAPNRQRITYSACLAALHGAHLARITMAAQQTDFVTSSHGTETVDAQVSELTARAAVGCEVRPNHDVMDTFISGMLGLVALLCAPLLAGMFKPTVDIRYPPSGDITGTDQDTSHIHTSWPGDGLGPYLHSLCYALGPPSSSRQEDSTPSRSSSASTGSSGSSQSKSDGYRTSPSLGGRRTTQSAGQVSPSGSSGGATDNSSDGSIRGRWQQMLHILGLHLPSAVFQIMDMAVWITSVSLLLLQPYLTQCTGVDECEHGHPLGLPVSFVAASVLVLFSSAGLLLLGSAMAYVASQAQGLPATLPGILSTAGALSSLACKASLVILAPHTLLATWLLGWLLLVTALVTGSECPAVAKLGVKWRVMVMSLMIAAFAVTAAWHTNHGSTVGSMHICAVFWSVALMVPVCLWRSSKDLAPLLPRSLSSAVLGGRQLQGEDSTSVHSKQQAGSDSTFGVGSPPYSDGQRSSKPPSLSTASGSRGSRAALPPSYRFSSSSSGVAHAMSADGKSVAQEDRSSLDVSGGRRLGSKGSTSFVDRISRGGSVSEGVARTHSGSSVSFSLTSSSQLPKISVRTVLNGRDSPSAVNVATPTMHALPLVVNTLPAASEIMPVTAVEHGTGSPKRKSPPRDKDVVAERVSMPDIPPTWNDVMDGAKEYDMLLRTASDRSSQPPWSRDLSMIIDRSDEALTADASARTTGIIPGLPFRLGPSVSDMGKRDWGAGVVASAPLTSSQPGHRGFSYSGALVQRHENKSSGGVAPSQRRVQRGLASMNQIPSPSVIVTSSASVRSDHHRSSQSLPTVIESPYVSQAEEVKDFLPGLHAALAQAHAPNSAGPSTMLQQSQHKAQGHLPAAPSGSRSRSRDTSSVLHVPDPMHMQSRLAPEVSGTEHHAARLPAVERRVSQPGSSRSRPQTGGGGSLLEQLNSALERMTPPASESEPLMKLSDDHYLHSHIYFAGNADGLSGAYAGLQLPAARASGQRLESPFQSFSHTAFSERQSLVASIVQSHDASVRDLPNTTVVAQKGLRKIDNRGAQTDAHGGGVKHGHDYRHAHSQPNLPGASGQEMEYQRSSAPTGDALDMSGRTKFIKRGPYLSRQKSQQTSSASASPSQSSGSPDDHDVVASSSAPSRSSDSHKAAAQSRPNRRSLPGDASSSLVHNISPPNSRALNLGLGVGNAAAALRGNASVPGGSGARTSTIITRSSGASRQSNLASIPEGGMLDERHLHMWVTPADSSTGVLPPSRTSSWSTTVATASAGPPSAGNTSGGSVMAAAMMLSAAGHTSKPKAPAVQANAASVDPVLSHSAKAGRATKPNKAAGSSSRQVGGGATTGLQPDGSSSAYQQPAPRSGDSASSTSWIVEGLAGAAPQLYLGSTEIDKTFSGGNNNLSAWRIVRSSSSCHGGLASVGSGGSQGDSGSTLARLLQTSPASAMMLNSLMQSSQQAIAGVNAQTASSPAGGTVTADTTAIGATASTPPQSQPSSSAGQKLLQLLGASGSLLQPWEGTRPAGHKQIQPVGGHQWIETSQRSSASSTGTAHTTTMLTTLTRWPTPPKASDRRDRSGNNSSGSSVVTDHAPPVAPVASMGGVWPATSVAGDAIQHAGSSSRSSAESVRSQNRRIVTDFGMGDNTRSGMPPALNMGGHTTSSGVSRPSQATHPSNVEHGDMRDPVITAGYERSNAASQNSMKAEEEVRKYGPQVGMSTQHQAPSGQHQQNTMNVHSRASTSSGNAQTLSSAGGDDPLHGHSTGRPPMSLGAAWSTASPPAAYPSVPSTNTHVFQNRHGSAQNAQHQWGIDSASASSSGNQGAPPATALARQSGGLGSRPRPEGLFNAVQFLQCVQHQQAQAGMSHNSTGRSSHSSNQ